MDHTRRPGGFVLLIRRLGIAVGTFFAFIGLLVTLAIVSVFWGLSRSAPDGQVLRDFKPGNPVAMTLNLAGAITAEEPAFTDFFLGGVFGNPGGIYLPELRAALRKGALDPRISGLEIELNALEGDMAEYAELRRIIADFRKSGKPVNVVLNEAYNWNYFIASSADRITLNPASSLIIPGPLFQLTYFGEFLKKLGIDVTVVRAGRFKSAFEPFIQNFPSESTLEQYQAMENALRTYMVEKVAEGRGRPQDEVRSWFKTSLYTAEAALKEGMVDEIGYGAAKAETSETTGVKFQDYSRMENNDLINNQAVTGQGGLALIEATGGITMIKTDAFEDSITPASMRDKLLWARENDDVKAVVLRVDSPGGSAVASDIIWRDVKLLAETKPVVVSMGAYAASGGYYIAAPATRIVAEPTTVTGSIGVIGALPNFAAFEDKWGISFHTVTGSDRGALFGLGQKPTSTDLDLMGATIEETYETFVNKVAQGRGLKIDVVRQLAQGRVYTGLEAVRIGLVDQLGGLQTAFDEAKRLAGFDPAKLYPIIHYQKDRFSLAECLTSAPNMMRCLQAGESGINILSIPQKEWPTYFGYSRELPQRLKAWMRVLSRERVLALWPHYLAFGNGT